MFERVFNTWLIFSKKQKYQIYLQEVDNISKAYFPRNFCSSFLYSIKASAYLAFTCSKLTIEILEQGVKYAQS